jgi:DNA/RNA-binding domain of Phe-tRNA-synthetase-like protein
MDVGNTLREQGLRVGVVRALGVTIRPSGPELAAALDALTAERQQQDFPSAELKEAVRGLLRTGGFKPSGRSKPASEYLAQAAREQRFPRINNLVDVNNLLSLRSGLPISLLDADVVGTRLVLRFGAAAERYVFNGAGHEIDLAGLICACGAREVGEEPLGNPVKDSLRGKISDATRNVVGIAYAPAVGFAGADLEALVADFGRWLRSEGGASSVEAGVY